MVCHPNAHNSSMVPHGCISAILVAMSDPKPDPRTQAEKFRDVARELECDEDPEAFKAKLRKVATAPKSAKGDPAKS